MIDTANSLVYRTSSRCTGASCVALAVDAQEGVLVVKDTKDADGPVLRFTAEEMRDWIAGAKAGEFDDMVAALSS